ncbi:hypothetical protein [Streptomyces sp. NPDC005970]|uniref:hypothetical protein n=1 Tax=Streptomyces sp. NPDC005970 TaxID=3156723 RepID=UPI0033C510C9
MTAAAELEIHTDRLTRAHLDVLYAFLKERTDRLLTAHPTVTEEHRAALALETAVEMTGDNIRTSFTYDTGLDRDLEDRRDAWNPLHQLAMPWKDDPNFDPTRWPRTRYIPLRAVDERLAETETDAGDLPL